MNAKQKIAIAKRRYPVGCVVQSAYTNRLFIITEGTEFYEPSTRTGLMAKVPTPGATGGHMYYHLYFTPKQIKEYGRRHEKININRQGWTKSSALYQIDKHEIFNFLNAGIPSGLAEYKNLHKPATFLQQFGRIRVDQAEPGHDSAVFTVRDYAEGTAKVQQHGENGTLFGPFNYDEITHLSPEAWAALKERVASSYSSIFIDHKPQTEIDREEWPEHFNAPAVAMVKNEDGQFDIYPKSNNDLRESMSAAASDDLPGVHDQEDKPSASWSSVCSVCQNVDSPVCFCESGYPEAPTPPPLRIIKDPTMTFEDSVLCFALVIVIAHVIFGLFVAAKYISEW